MESAVGAFAWRCSLLLTPGSEHRTDHVGPRWVSFAAKVQYLSRTAQPEPPSPWMGEVEGTPTPRRTRPPDTASIVAMARAVAAVSRCGRTRIENPKRTRRVREASAANI